MRRDGYRVWVGLAICHLLFVAISAGGLEVPDLGRVGNLLDLYGDLSGSNEKYGFFAPGIGGQFGVFFDLIDGNGKKQTLQLESGINHETDLRIGNIFNQFYNESIKNTEGLRR